MMDRSKFNPSGKNTDDMKASDFLGKNIKVVVSEVGTVTYNEGKEDENSKTFLKFEGKEKRLILNASNNERMCGAYGNDDDEWIGKELHLTTQEYKAEGFPPGWIVSPQGVEFDDDIPF